MRIGKKTCRMLRDSFLLSCDDLHPCYIIIIIIIINNFFFVRHNTVF